MSHHTAPTTIELAITLFISDHRTSVKSPITFKGLNPMDTPIPVPFDLLVLDTVYPPFLSSFDFQIHVLLILFLYLGPITS